jgi:enhancer of polycomb-like protein
MVKRREQLRKETLEVDRLVFEQRLALRDTKRKLGVKGDEDLLINQKVRQTLLSQGNIYSHLSQKQKVPQGMTPNQAAIAQQLRMPMAPGPGPELRTLEDVAAAREREIQREIQTNIEKHIRWNEGFVDKTMAPLTPDIQDDYPSPGEHFREAMAATEYLPTPPASISDEESQGLPNGTDVVMKDVSRPSTPFRYASPADEDTVSHMPSFRRRIGRGGRILIDRRLPRAGRDSFKEDDRWKYDSPDEDDFSDEELTFPDLTFARMSQRAYLIGSSRPSENAQVMAARKSQSETAGPSHSSPAGHTQPTPAPS